MACFACAERANGGNGCKDDPGLWQIRTSIRPLFIAKQSTKIAVIVVTTMLESA